MRSLEDILAERNSIVDELTERAESLIQDDPEPVQILSRDPERSSAVVRGTPSRSTNLSRLQEYREQVVCHWPYYHPEPVTAKLIRTTYMGFLEGFSRSIDQVEHPRFHLAIDLTPDTLLFDLDLAGQIFGNRDGNRIAPGEILVLLNSSKTLGLVSTSSGRSRIFNPVTGRSVPSNHAKGLTICSQAWVLHLQSCRSSLRIELTDDPDKGPSSFQLNIRKESDGKQDSVDIQTHLNQVPVIDTQGSALRTVILNKTYTIDGEYLMTLSHYQIFPPEREQIMVNSQVSHFQLLLQLLRGSSDIPTNRTPIDPVSDLGNEVCSYPLDGEVRIKSRE